MNSKFKRMITPELNSLQYHRNMIYRKYVQPVVEDNYEYHDDKMKEIINFIDKIMEHQSSEVYDYRTEAEQYQDEIDGLKIEKQRLQESLEETQELYENTRHKNEKLEDRIQILQSINEGNIREHKRLRVRNRDLVREQDKLKERIKELESRKKPVKQVGRKVSPLKLAKIFSQKRINKLKDNVSVSEIEGLQDDIDEKAIRTIRYMFEKYKDKEIISETPTWSPWDEIQQPETDENTVNNWEDFPEE